MTHCKTKLKSSGDKASPCFKPFWAGELSDKYLPTRTSIYFQDLLNAKDLIGS
jgi:hypothetical protein